MRKPLAAAAALSLLLATTGGAFAAPPGFGSETQSGQGNINNGNVQDNPGTVTETTTGPKGALKNDKDTPNQETTTSGPGNGNNR